MELQFLMLIVPILASLAFMGFITDVYARFGSDRVLPNRKGMKTVTVGNEDVGLNATLTTTTNDNFTWTNPAPEEFTFGQDMLLIGEMRFAMERMTRDADDSSVTSALIYMSAIDRAFTATYRAALADANDEALRSYFVKHMPIGQISAYASGNAGIEAVRRNQLTNEVRSLYRFPTWTPQPIPLNITIVNGGNSYVVAGDETPTSFSNFEQFYYEYDYDIRPMNRSEQAFYDGPSGWLPRMGLISS